MAIKLSYFAIHATYPGKYKFKPQERKTYTKLESVVAIVFHITRTHTAGENQNDLMQQWAMRRKKYWVQNTACSVHHILSHQTALQTLQNSIV